MNSKLINSPTIYIFAALAFFMSATTPALTANAANQPNIIWVVIEDASPHIEPYGETLIKTPHLNQMAKTGILFENAFVTNPVCSPSRSAMVSGMYQTTLGAHNHRSQNTDAKAGGNTAYYASYQVPQKIDLIPDLFRQAGYFVTNGGKGKKDYNFIARSPVYDSGKDWSGRDKGQPFFAQIQVQGGKNRKAKIANMTNPADVTLPPYYPDHPIIREDWAAYLNSWVYVDNEIGKLFKQLEAEGIADQTIVFLWTDHGVSHVRGKQYLYDEGIRVPLIAWFGDGTHKGEVRTDLVSHIDISTTSLALAGIDIPTTAQGGDLFSDEYKHRRLVFAARDRCDETTDTIRAVRTERYKYIRNFRYFRSHTQPNQYKDGKLISQIMRELFEAGKLTELQGRVFQKRRPVEELYDIIADPHETINLATSIDHKRVVATLRGALYSWMVNSGDMGLVPEPTLEEIGRTYGSKYDAMQHQDQFGLIGKLLAMADADANGDIPKLKRGLHSNRPSVRYWAAIGLGNTGCPSDAAPLEQLLNDTDPSVRIAAARGLLLNGPHNKAVDVLAIETTHQNLVVGLYAMRAIEEVGDQAKGAAHAVLIARSSAYNTTVRIAERLIRQWGLTPKSK